MQIMSPLCRSSGTRQNLAFISNQIYSDQSIHSYDDARGARTRNPFERPLASGILPYG